MIISKHILPIETHITPPNFTREPFLGISRGILVGTKIFVSSRTLMDVAIKVSAETACRLWRTVATKRNSRISRIVLSVITYREIRHCFQNELCTMMLSINGATRCNMSTQKYTQGYVAQHILPHTTRIPIAYHYQHSRTPNSGLIAHATKYLLRYYGLFIRN